MHCGKLVTITVFSSDKKQKTSPVLTLRFGSNIHIFRETNFLFTQNSGGVEVKNRRRRQRKKTQQKEQGRKRREKRKRIMGEAKEDKKD